MFRRTAGVTLLDDVIVVVLCVHYFADERVPEA
jgi:hypothetical protein